MDVRGIAEGWDTQCPPRSRFDPWTSGAPAVKRATTGPPRLHDLVCVTETQLKIDKIQLCTDIVKEENMREIKDIKGGGLMILWRKHKNIENKI